MCSVLYREFSIVILAAGRGKRMLSNLPKVIHKIGSKCILQHLVDISIQCSPRIIYIVYGNYGKMIMSEIKIYNQDIPIQWVLQKDILGTAHAVNQVLPMVNDDENVLVLYGDVPLVSYKTLQKLLIIKEKCDIGLLTGILDDPTGYGRIIRNQNGEVINIIEDNVIDSLGDNINRNIREVYSGILIMSARYLKYWINQIIMCKLKKEFYLTDIVGLAYRKSCSIYTVHPDDIFEIIGINNKFDLIYLERIYQRKQADNLLLSGVLISDPNRFDLRGTLVHGKDICIDINVIIEGNVFLGNRVMIGAGCVLKDIVVEDDVKIGPFSIIENAKINLKSVVGPFSRLRSHTELQESSCVGNFVELKNVRLGKKSKVKHLSYLGDAQIGSNVNIGAGSITCNYDGIKKHNTIIGDGVVIGADSQLIAPVSIDRNAVVGAGTTVTDDVSQGDKIISRIRQFSILHKD